MKKHDDENQEQWEERMSRRTLRLAVVSAILGTAALAKALLLHMG